jgi:hypothetical protein
MARRSGPKGGPWGPGQTFGVVTDPEALPLSEVEMSGC